MVQLHPQLRRSGHAQAKAPTRICQHPQPLLTGSPASLPRRLLRRRRRPHRRHRLVVCLPSYHPVKIAVLIPVTRIVQHSKLSLEAIECNSNINLSRRLASDTAVHTRSPALQGNQHFLPKLLQVPNPSRILFYDLLTPLMHLMQFLIRAKILKHQPTT